MAFTTDYLFRGISRTDNGPAIQGNLQYIYRPWGVYLGAWASNVDTVTSDGEIEIDWTGGIRGQFTDTGIGWDLGAIYYHFPGDDLDPEKDYVEAKLGLSYKLQDIPLEPAASVTVYYSPDFYFETGDAVYIDTSLRLTLPFGIGLGLHIGYQSVDEVDIADLDGDANESYVDWRIGLSKEILGLTLGVSYWDAGDEESLSAGAPDHRIAGQHRRHDLQAILRAPETDRRR
ncbi:MAG: TorF family putative porin [Pseudomonadota bacterium]|nr:TorF family putative porin [Pseudomonadota bacterium]